MAADASNATESDDGSPVATSRPKHRRLGVSTSAAIDLLFPPQCASCGSECYDREDGTLLCESCLVELVPAVRPTCRYCALPCSDTDAAAGDCFECRSRKLRYDEARTLGIYEGPLRRAVLQIKHHYHVPLAKALGQRLALCLRERPFTEHPDLVAPVPMHWLRRLWRGTNAAETLARAVAGELGLPVAAHLLVCRRMLRRQSTLSTEDRWHNVRNAYRTAWGRRARGLRVLLVDDVMTTRATAHEAARALRKAGAAAVYVAAVARGTGGF
jgi:ComF family protein